MKVDEIINPSLASLEHRQLYGQRRVAKGSAFLSTKCHYCLGRPWRAPHNRRDSSQRESHVIRSEVPAELSRSTKQRKTLPHTTPHRLHVAGREEPYRCGLEKTWVSQCNVELLGPSEIVCARWRNKESCPVDSESTDSAPPPQPQSLAVWKINWCSISREGMGRPSSWLCRADLG